MSPNPNPSFVYLLFILITRATSQLAFLHVGTSLQSHGEEQRRELKCQTHDKKARLGDPPRACHVSQLLDTCFSSKHRGFIFQRTTHTPFFSTLFIYMKAPTSDGRRMPACRCFSEPKRQGRPCWAKGMKSMIRACKITQSCLWEAGMLFQLI